MTMDIKIQSYTSLEQSQKLAEFLPLESADMYYHKDRNNDFVQYPHFVEEYQSMTDRKIVFGDNVIPCWSLAALLDVLPKIINHETLFVEALASLWHVGYRGIYTVRSFNLVDACYEMVVELHEQNLL